LTAAWQLIARAELRLGEGLAEGAPDAHHFPGGFHFRPQQRVYPRELDEGKHRFLDGIIGGNHLAGYALRGQTAPDHAAGGDFGQRASGGFRDIRHSAGSAGVDFKHINIVALNGELGVH
jgi:hypothetical protein